MQRGAEDVLSRETIPRAMRWVMVAGTGRQFGLQEKECWCADAGIRFEHFNGLLETEIRSEPDARAVSELTVDLLQQQFRFAEEVDSGARDNVFFSYAHHDRAWLESIRSHFNSVPGQQLTLWDDSQCWNDDILHRLIRSAAAVLVVTPRFVRSQYISNHELPMLIRQQRANFTRLFWIPVEDVPEGERQALKDINAALDPARP